ncbi:MAG TPA: Gfo/Idh/MocA family oxidoreductase [Symbiobacteriaceae bacterium]|nr:Gfo/Idh/MocA family oxidoreductase [Symbiobacteriaceae bacterium]
MNRITVGVVGLGSIALKAHLPVLVNHPGVEIVGLASRTGARVADLTAQFRLALKARTFEEILALKPAAAYLLSATEAHPDQAVALLNAGIAVYMEKPLANDLDGARRIVEAAEGRFLMVGFNRRYAPAYRRAKELFGGRPPELIQITKHRSGDHSGWSVRQVVMDDTIHIIDLARFFAGEATVAASICRTGLAAAQLATNSGAVVHLSQSYGAGAATERVELHGGGLTVIVEEMEHLRIREHGKERVEPLFGSWSTTLEKKGMAGATEHFLTCLRTGAQPDTTAAEAFRTQELAEAILTGGAG